MQTDKKPKKLNNRKTVAILYLNIYSHITEFLLPLSFLIRVSDVSLIWCLLEYAHKKNPKPLHYSNWQVFSWTETYEGRKSKTKHCFLSSRIFLRNRVRLSCVRKKLGCWSDVHTSWLLTNCSGKINPSFEALRSQTL